MDVKAIAIGNMNGGDARTSLYKDDPQMVEELLDAAKVVTFLAKMDNKSDRVHAIETKIPEQKDSEQPKAKNSQVNSQ